MTISKEIFGIDKKDKNYNMPDDWIIGYNRALKDIDQFELSEKELEKIIFSRVEYQYLPKEDCYMIGNPKELAQAIIQNKSKIFVRKTK